MFPFYLCFGQESLKYEYNMTAFQISALFNEHYYIASGFC